MPLLRQAIWGHIWKHTVEKSQRNATNVTLPLLGQALWGDILKHTVEKSQTNATNEITQPCCTMFVETFKNTKKKILNFTCFTPFIFHSCSLYNCPRSGHCPLWFGLDIPIKIFAKNVYMQWSLCTVSNSVFMFSNEQLSHTGQLNFFSQILSTMSSVFTWSVWRSTQLLGFGQDMCQLAGKSLMEVVPSLLHSPQPHRCLSGTHVNKQTCCHQANVYIVNKMGQPCRMLIRSAYPNQQMVTSYILETTPWTAKYQHVHVDKICLF